MAGLILIALLAVAALASRFGVDSRPEFSGHPDWRDHSA